jgi:hypothetical protein
MSIQVISNEFVHVVSNAICDVSTISFVDVRIVAGHNCNTTGYRFQYTPGKMIANLIDISYYLRQIIFQSSEL